MISAGRTKVIYQMAEVRSKHTKHVSLREFAFRRSENHERPHVRQIARQELFDVEVCCIWIRLRLGPSWILEELWDDVLLAMAPS